MHMQTQLVTVSDYFTNAHIMTKYSRNTYTDK